MAAKNLSNWRGHRRRVTFRQFLRFSLGSRSTDRERRGGLHRRALGWVVDRPRRRANASNTGGTCLVEGQEGLAVRGVGLPAPMAHIE
jgi:hypothetical protein